VQLVLGTLSSKGCSIIWSTNIFFFMTMSLPFLTHVIALGTCHISQGYHRLLLVHHHVLLLFGCSGREALAGDKVCEDYVCGSKPLYSAGQGINFMGKSTNNSTNFI
jgi:hypothetical protein